jgi:dCTP diphosphatase
MIFAELTEQILAFRDARDWAQFHKPKDMAAAVAIEAAELQEHFLWKTHEESAEHLAKHGAAVAEEMADIAIYLFIMAADAGIDLGQAMQAKLAINEKRYPADQAKGRHNKYTDYEPDDE